MKKLYNIEAVKILTHHYEPDGIKEPFFSHNGYDYHSLAAITLNQFEEFLNSLDEEKKTWQLDMQDFNSVSEWYYNFIENHPAMIAMKEGEVVGIWSAFCGFHKNSIFKGVYGHRLCSVSNIYSYVVKKEHQRKGLSSMGLYNYIILLHTLIKEFTFVNYNDTENYLLPKDLLILDTARTHLDNMGSRYLLEKLQINETTSVH